ncbi:MULTISPECIES: hypothetical protein [unclassified Achromobacter]|uniref:hypothetical protein n=1 Tax=unclassified Achromobacter TaxID=2626865 RepID=UPI000B5171AE|nr:MULTISPECIES: hypothetical protein [unclassified Achromobacter]OWT67334.1 hypothetical protein CEY05_30565 [Achromobacter sp. HZ34]OWT67351.1 hypothetical protein CEY04_30640 [Achromobacter sp. HZ28]
MSSSAAFASSPAPDADSFGLRPLDAIAATSNGGVPQSRVHRILTDLAAPLTALHEQGQIHGALSPATIGLDMTGKAHLMPRPPAPAEGEDEFDLPQAGYAAFEQYADDELLPRGPWTDVYGLSAVACQLITGAPPPDAEARRDGDEYLPLVQRMPASYDAAFLAAVDAGLAMAAARRPNSMSAYLALFGGMEPAPAMPALSEPEVVVVQDEYDEEDDDELEPKARRRLSFWAVFIVLLAAVVAVPIWLWLTSGNGFSGNRTPRVGAAGGSSFVPLTQRDPRAADAGRPAGSDATSGAGAAGSAAGGGSAGAGGTDGGTAGGYANGARGGVQGGNPGGGVSNGGSNGGPNGVANGAASGSSSGGASGNLAAAPASTLNGSGNPANTGANPGAAAAEGGAGSGGENVAAGGSGNTGTPDAAAMPAGAGAGASAGASGGAAAGGQSAPAAGDSANAGRAAGAAQPYHSTVTLGGGAPATAGAQPPRATDGAGAGSPASGDASADAQAEAGQGTQARTGAAAAGTTTAATTKPAATGAPVPVRIDVRPWGEIIVDGVARGVSPPLKELRLAPGKHSVIIKNTGLPNFRMTLEVKAGTPATISHVFN